MAAPEFRVRDIQVEERPVELRLPFRYGVVTIREARQAFVKLRIHTRDGRSVEGRSAELLAVKWFDKSPDLTDQQNEQQLRDAMALAIERYSGDGAWRTAFGLHAAHQRDLYAEAASRGLNGLVAGFGLAILDKAVVDAVCRLEDLSFFDAVRANRIGLNSATAPDLAEVDIGKVLASLTPVSKILARHTVGFVDILKSADIDDPVDDGLPESLEDAIRFYGLRAFKIKLSGNLEADLERLGRIARVLDGIDGDYLSTLDGNEQYATVEALEVFWRRLQAAPGLDRLRSSIRFVEQPISRDTALNTALGPLGQSVPVEIDESDDGIDAFPTARALGYRGVSSKSCKGVYRALINRIRVGKWNEGREGGPYFISAEDLCCQAGLAVQQDLALAAILGCEHGERNGHHYGNGITGLEPGEIARFARDHPGLYLPHPSRLSLRISGGLIDLTSLSQAALRTAD